jgi:hypothetical protein
MKKLLPIILVGILVVSGLGAVAVQENDDETLFNIESMTISEPIITETSEYLTVSLEESESLLLGTGKPMLPVITNVFTFPLGTKIVDIKVDFDTQKQVLSKKIQPSPKPVPLTNDLPFEKISAELVMDEEIYSSSALYPVESYTIREGAGISNGENVLFVNVKVIPQYSPADDILYVPQGDIAIEIEYELPKTPFFTGMETYDLLIITPQEFLAGLQPLITHKNSIGVETILKTTEEIYSEYSEGRDDPEKIKLCIYDMKETYDISYVLLAGGREGQTFKWYVPERRTNNDDGWESGYSSDLYYADIYKIVENETVFEDWDSDGDGKFAEFGFRGDKMDFYPDVSVGRIPFRYSSEIDTIVDKIINYENTADDSWFKKAVVIAGDTSPPSRSPGCQYGVYEGEVSTAVTVGLLENAGFDVEKLWLSIPGAWTGSSDVINAISAGAGFIHFAGHGNPASWGNHPPDDEDHEFIQGFQLRDMSKYTNGYKLPVIVIGGCHNGQFNVTMSNILNDIKEYGIKGYFFDMPMRFYYMEWVPRDSASWFLMEEGGGSIGTIANAGLGYGYRDEYVIEGLGGWLNPRFFDAYANQSKEILGEAHAQAITDYIDIIGSVNSDNIDRKSIEGWVLIGDPSLKLGGY